MPHLMFRPDPLADPKAAIRVVYAYAEFRLQNRADAEDVVSETIERALRYRGSYDARKGSPNAWLVGIARRTIAEQVRAQAASALEARADMERGDDERERHLDRLVLRDAIRRLPPRDQDLLALRYGADMTVREIAKLVGMQANTVDVALSRARRRLEALLQPDHGESAPARERS